MEAGNVTEGGAAGGRGGGGFGENGAALPGGWIRPRGCPSRRPPPPLAGALAEAADPATIKVKLTLSDVTFQQLLDAVVLVADQPIKYSVEDYGVIFSKPNRRFRGGTAGARNAHFQSGPEHVL